MEVRYRDLGDSILLKAFGHSPKLRIMDIFLTNPYFDFSKQELVRELGMSKQTLYRYFRDLQALRIIVPSRKIGRATMYRINRQHPLVKQLDEMITKTSLQIAEEQTKRPSERIVLRATPGSR